MEDKFLFFAILALFAAFGTIETRHNGHRENWPRNNGTSFSHGRNNSSWHLRPFGTVPPPTNQGRHNGSWPYRPFGTVPPPRPYGTQNPWVRQPWHPRPQQQIDCGFSPIGCHPGPLYRPLGYNHPRFLQRNFNNNETVQLSNNSTTGFHTSLSGLGEAQGNGIAGGTFGIALNGTGKPSAPDYQGNSSSWDSHYFPNQTYLMLREKAHAHHGPPMDHHPHSLGRNFNNNETIQLSNNSTTGLYPSLSGLGESQGNGIAGGTFGTAPNGTGRPSAPDYQGNSSSWDSHYFPNQTYLMLQEKARREKTGDDFQIVPNSTASHFVPVYQGNSTAQ